MVVLSESKILILMSKLDVKYSLNVKTVIYSLNVKTGRKMLILNQQKEVNDHRNYFSTKVWDRAGIKLATPESTALHSNSYSKCSKISNVGCLPKRPGQTVQSQIRLLLKKQSDQGLPCLLI